MKKLILLGLSLCLLINAQAQDVTYTTADIVAGVVPGSTSAILTKSGYSLTITKTGGTSNPLNGTYPTSAPLNTLPEDFTHNIEGLHIGRTWGANGSGWVGAWGELRSETYTFDFSDDVDKFQFLVGALNDNADGIEKLRIVDILDGATSVLASCSFGIQTDFAVIESDTIYFNQATRDIEGVGTPGANGWNESSKVTISSTKKFNRIVFERTDYINNRPDKNAGGENYTNGVTITGFATYIAQPEIDVQGNQVSIVDGDVTPTGTDSTHFGNVSIIGTKTNTYWIHNTGTGVLSLTGGTPITISGSGDFSVTQALDNTIAAGDSTSFTVTFDPSSLGTKTAIVTIANDDSNENPYTFTVQAAAVNSNPVAVKDNKTTPEDVCVNIDVQVNDNDPESETLTTSIIDNGNHGTATLLNADSLNYCPNSNYNGKDTILYQICDGLGACDIDTVFITVNPVNDDPIADTDYKTTNENVCVNIDVQLNDTDADGNGLTTTIIDNGNHGTASLLNADSLSYCPNSNYNGKDTILYQICDGNGGCDIDTVFITVNPVNNDPDADTDYKTVNEDNCINIDVQLNDIDPDGDALTTSIITNAPHGNANVLNGDSLAYCPDANYNGKDTIIYQICDGNGGCDIDTVFITVNPVNDDPIAVTDYKSTLKNVCVTVKVQTNDSDPDGDGLTTSISINGLHGVGSVLSNDSISYCPNNNYFGKDTLLYQICDGNGGCDIDTVYININSVNNDPDADTDYKTVNEDNCINIDVQVNDTDPDGDFLTTTIITNAPHGNATILNGDSLTYCPDLNYNGKDTIIYQICDDLGGCDIDTVFITVNPVNDDPDADTDYKTTQEDVCTYIDVQVNDTDPDGDALTTSIIDNGNHGTASLANNDSLYYCPNIGYNGNDTILYQICDGNGGCDIDTVFITVTNVNNDPDADTDYKTVNEDNCINIDVQVNDTDPDGDVLTTTIITNAPHGNATILNGDSLNYCPDLNYNGKDTIIYQICDGLGGCDIDTVFITVNPVNDDPDANTDKKTTNKNVCVVVKVQVNDTDPDGDNLTSSIVNNANYGTGTVLNGDSISYCPNNNYVGKDTLIYEICDGNGGCDQDTIIITVLQVLDPYVIAVDDTLTIYANDYNSKNYVIDIQKNDTDYNGGYLTSVIFKDPTSGGQITVLNNDSVVYKAPNGFSGKDTIQYIVCSSIGSDLNDCDTAYIYITVIAADCDKDGIADWNDNAKDCEFFIPEGFSPNGDNVNDTWFIRGILDYPENHVQIFNRWGNLVFETDGYKNEWNGTTMFGLTVGGNDLPEGTYFYIVDLGNNTKVYKGYVYLKR